MLWLGTFDVDFSSKDIRMPNIIDQFLGYSFVLEHYKAETARLTSVNVLQDHSVLDLAELREMLQKVVLR